MIDVSRKFETLREAVAEARVEASPETLKKITAGGIPKGSIREFAMAAGMLGAKRTSELIPHCHPVPLDNVEVTCEVAETCLVIRVYVKAVWRTGVEIEALTAASIAALTAYDMLKFTGDPALAISAIRIVEKRGGYSDFREQLAGLRAGVLVVSTSTAAGKRSDKSGKLIAQRLEQEGVAVVEYRIVPDSIPSIAGALREMTDVLRLDLVVSTGGTGLSPADLTIEAAREVIDREVPGISEAARGYGQRRTPYAMLSRSLAGIRGRALILTLPGSSRGVSESLDALLPGLLHAFPMLWQQGHVEVRSG